MINRKLCNGIVDKLKVLPDVEICTVLNKWKGYEVLSDDEVTFVLGIIYRLKLDDFEE